MTHDAISKTARDQLDAEYEASTQGADAWRDRVAQRHRFGRALDKPLVVAPLKGDGIQTGLMWALVVVAWSIWLGYVVWSLT